MNAASSYVFITIVYQSHLILKIVDLTLQALPWFHPNYEEMVATPLELSLRSELIVEGVSYIIELRSEFFWSEHNQW